MNKMNALYLFVAIIIVTAFLGLIATSGKRVKASSDLLEVCNSTCYAVATDVFCSNDTGVCDEVTIPHDYLMAENKYCMCLFQGKGDVFVFDASLKAALMEEK